LIAGATARAASRLLEQNQADKIKAGFLIVKALAEYNEKETMPSRKVLKLKRNFTKITTNQQFAKRSFRS
jgi:adenine/guanine phosphoribosyltransferase-like PRPP-binding protein